MTPPWPTTGPNGGERSSPRWTITPCACSPGRMRAVRSAGITCSPPTSRRSPRTTGNDGGNRSPVRRSPRTTSSTTGDPAHRTMIKPASCTPPADAGFAPADAGTSTAQPARPRGLLEPYAATSGTYGSEGGSAGQPAGPTRRKGGRLRTETTINDTRDFGIGETTDQSARAAGDRLLRQPAPAARPTTQPRPDHRRRRPRRDHRHRHHRHRHPHPRAAVRRPAYPRPAVRPADLPAAPARIHQQRPAHTTPPSCADSIPARSPPGR